jgi:hypothetical protein
VIATRALAVFRGARAGPDVTRRAGERNKSQKPHLSRDAKDGAPHDSKLLKSQANRQSGVTIPEFWGAPSSTIFKGGGLGDRVHAKRIEAPSAPSEGFSNARCVV